MKLIAEHEVCFFALFCSFFCLNSCKGFKKVDMQALSHLCASVNNDIRQILNLLQMLRLTTDVIAGSASSFEQQMANGRTVNPQSFLRYSLHFFSSLFFPPGFSECFQLCSSALFSQFSETQTKRSFGLILSGTLC